MRTLPALLLTLFLAACGTGDDGRYGDRLLPLVPGATWDYRTADATGAPGARTLRVEGEENGLLVLESREDGLRTRSFLQVSALVLAVREEAQPAGGEATVEFFDPGALRGLSRADLEEGEVFEHSWHEQRQGAPAEEVSARWVVEAVGETVRVRAGIFEDAVRIRRTQSDGNDAILWYAPGVGLLRSEGAEQLELIHWALP